MPLPCKTVGEISFYFSQESWFQTIRYGRSDEANQQGAGPWNLEKNDRLSPSPERSGQGKGLYRSSALAHSDHEMVSLAEFCDGAQVYEVLLEEMLL